MLSLALLSAHPGSGPPEIFQVERSRYSSRSVAQCRSVAACMVGFCGVLSGDDIIFGVTLPHFHRISRRMGLTATGQMPFPTTVSAAKTR